METLDVNVLVQQRSYECHIGFAGAMNGDYSDCFWRKYTPQIPIIELVRNTSADMDLNYWAVCIN